MLIDFIQNDGDQGLIEVHLGKILHGYIIQMTPKKYRYFRLTNNKAIQRHEADSLDVLKRMVLETP